MIEFFIIHSNPEVIEFFKGTFEQLEGCRFAGHADTGKDALFLLGSTPAQAVLVQLSQADMDGFDLIQEISKKYPDVYIVPILEGNETGDVWQKILQLNLRDVINGFSTEAVIPVLNNASKRAEEHSSQFEGRRGQSYVIAVASARGGTGKSLFATNLVLSMTKLKRPPCLIDYSMYAGDFFTMLDFVPRNTLADAISQEGIDLQFLSTLISDHPLGFKFLSCPNQDFDYYNFDYDRARTLIQVARGISEYVVVDTGAFDMPATLAAIDEADLVFLVTTRDLARLLSLQRYIKFLQERNNLSAKLKVIINNAEIGTEISETEIESVLEHEVTAYLPSNPIQTTFSINSGKPLNSSKTELPLCKVIHRLAELCSQHWQTE